MRLYPEYERLLTPEEEIELARRVHGPDRADAVAARDELVLHNVGLVGKIVGRIANHFRHLEYEDLFSEAIVALVQVAERYDPGIHQTRFSTYAVPDIRGRLRNFANQRRLPVGGEREDRADAAPAPHEKIIVAEEYGIAVAAMGKLPALKAYVIARRFGLGEAETCTLRDIARELECSYEYVRRLQAEAISQLACNNRR